MVAIGALKGEPSNIDNRGRTFSRNVSVSHIKVSRGTGNMRATYLMRNKCENYQKPYFNRFAFQAGQMKIQELQLDSSPTRAWLRKLADLCSIISCFAHHDNNI